MNTKFGYGDNIQVFDIERGKSDKSRKFPRRTETSVGKKAWGYIEGETQKSSNQIIDDLIDIVSKNGNMLLNIGPRPDGIISQGQREVLLDIGGWLKVNGEAIYGTRPWIIAVEGNEEGTSGAFSDNEETKYSVQDIRITRNEDAVYAICLEWDDEGVLIKSIGEEHSVSGVSMLGSKEEIKWIQTVEGIRVDYPREKPSDFAHALKIKMHSF